MEDEIAKNFIRRRMARLREDNGWSQSRMAKECNRDKSVISRVENINVPVGYKTVRELADKYCSVFQLNDKQREFFWRGDRVVVVDTSALLKNRELIDELIEQYNRVIIPDVVRKELNRYKDSKKFNDVGFILKSISSEKRVYIVKYTGNGNIKNDEKIVEVAIRCSKDFNCNVDVIANDVDIGCIIKEKNDPHLNYVSLISYMRTKQNLSGIDFIYKLKDMYPDDYSDLDKEFDKYVSSPEVLNSYLGDGLTLIIDVVLNKKFSFDERAAKIRWLVSKGADINQRDTYKYNLTALIHSIKRNDFKMFEFLLDECGADPNAFSRNPYDSSKIRDRNECNTPLMVASWHGREDFVRKLCSDNRISLNQQDGNGFTALIKAAMNAHYKCISMLIDAGADEKIIDRDGFTYRDRLKEAMDKGGD